MSRKIIDVAKGKIDHPGATLQELKVMRQEGRMYYGPEIEVKINRYASHPCGGVSEMDQSAVRGVNSIPEGAR